MKPLKKKISITLDENVLTQITILAELEDRPVSQYINLILRTALKAKEPSISHSQSPPLSSGDSAERKRSTRFMVGGGSKNSDQPLV